MLHPFNDASILELMLSCFSYAQKDFSASTLPPDDLTFDQGYGTVSVDGFQSEGTNKHTDNNRDFKVRW